MIRLLGTTLLGPTLCRGVVQAGVGLALQSTLLLCLGLLAGRALRRRGPELPALVYRVTLVAVLLGSLLAVTLGGWLTPLRRLAPPTASRPVLAPAWGRAPAARVDTEATGPRLLPPTGSAPDGPTPRPSSGAGAAAGTALVTPPPAAARPAVGTGWVYVALTGTWLGGVLALLGWLLLCQVHLGRLRRGGVPVDGPAAAALLELCGALGVRPPRLRRSGPAGSPLLTGLFRPVILLPAGCERELDGPALRAVLAHELVHLRRQDCAWNLLARLACALLWPQPLLWLLGRRLRETSEAVCDQEVVRLEGDPRGYARCLLLLSDRFLPTRAEALLGVGAAPFRTGLGRRIQQIVTGPRPRPLSARGRAAVLLGAGAAVSLALYLLPAGAALLPAGSDAAAGPDRSARVTEAAGGEAALSRRSPLARAPALEKPVTVTETRIPLGELVARVAADTGVTLTASAEVADEPVDVVVKDLPARELLEQMADLLDYRWMQVGRRGENRFQIYQDAAGRRREEALREAALAGAWQQLQAKIDSTVRMAARPPAEIERLLAEEKRWGERRLQLPYAERLVMDDKDRARQREFWMAESLASPVARCEATLVGRLTPPQWAALRQGQPLVFSTEPQAGELPLPEETARAFRAARPNMGNGMHYGPEHEAQERQRQRSMQDEWMEATGYQVRIALDTSRFQSDGQLGLEAVAIPLHGTPSDSPAAFLHTNGTAFGVGVGPASLDSWDMDETEEKARAARRAALENDPVFGVKKPLKVDVRPRRPDEPYWKGAWGLGEMLPDVARTFGVSLISDAYTWDRTTSRFASATPVALYDLLDRLAGDRHVWDYHSRLVRFRYRAWPFVRRQEVPMRLLRRWQRLLDRDGALPLSEWLSAASTLTDLQLDTLLHIGLFREGAAAFNPRNDPRYALRLYLSLTPGQQQALWRGASLPFARMTPAQQAQFLATLRDQAQMRQGIMAPGSGPAIGPEASLSLTSDRQVWVFEQHGTSTHIHYEPVPAVSPAPPAAAPRPASPAAPAAVTRRTITTVTFRFQSGSGMPATVPVDVSSLQ